MQSVVEHSEGFAFADAFFLANSSSFILGLLHFRKKLCFTTLVHLKLFLLLGRFGSWGPLLLDYGTGKVIFIYLLRAEN
jgi:hypothetical protein